MIIGLVHLMIGPLHMYLVTSLPLVAIEILYELLKLFDLLSLAPFELISEVLFCRLHPLLGVLLLTFHILEDFW